MNQANFNHKTTPAWGNMEKEVKDLDTKNDDMDAQTLTVNKHKKIEQYDIQKDIQHKVHKIQSGIHYNTFKSNHHPQIMDNNEYYKLRQMLNREQQAIIKDIVKKKIKNNKNLLHLFLTGGAGTGKTFTAKAIYQALLRIYNKYIDSDPNKPKGLITAYTGKSPYNVGGFTLHSTFHIPFITSDFLSLNSDILDAMSKHYDQLCVLLIDEISLVGVTFLRYIDKRLREIMQMPTIYFGNVNIIFYGDLYQAQPVLDAVIFENKVTMSELMPYNLWIDIVKIYSLTHTIR